MSTHARPQSLFDAAIVRQAVKDSLLKLSPVHLLKNPVMFVVEVGSALTTALFVAMLVGVVVIVVALSYFPALALGPLAEGITR